MPGVVTVSGQVKCADGGMPTLSSGAKLTVSGSAAMLFSAVPSLTPYTGCSFQVSGSPKPCTVATPSGGSAGKLTAGSQPVLLDSLSGVTDNASTVSATAGATKLTAS